MEFKINQEKLWKSLSLAQQKIVFDDHPIVLIIAGPGSGKTRVLTYKIIKTLIDGWQPEEILALTFTTKAAYEIRQRIQNIINPPLPFIGTFHSLAYRILKRFYPNFIVLDDNETLNILKTILKKNSLNISPFKAKNIIVKYKNKIIHQFPLDFYSQLDIFHPQIKKLILAYQETLLKLKAFDFDDLLRYFLELTLKPEFNEIKKQIKWIFVDEYQDINSAQYLFLKTVTLPETHLWVVGDDAQSIYNWRFSDLNILFRFQHDWPTAKIFILEENFRSSVGILKAAESLINHNQFQFPKKLIPYRQEFKPIRILKFLDERKEAQGIVKLIKELDYELDKIAILYRLNKQNFLFQQELFKNNIPFQVYGGKIFNYQEFKIILSLVRYFYQANLIDERKLKKTLKLSKKELIELKNKFDQKIKSTPLGDILKGFLKNKLTLTEEINNFLNFINCFNENFDRDSFVDFLGRYEIAPFDKKGIKLLTLHLAKGLEFDCVFIVSVEEGILPYFKNQHSLALEEERRLFYVGLTRAREEVILTFRQFFNFKIQRPSRFLKELPPEVVSFQTIKD